MTIEPKLLGKAIRAARESNGLGLREMARVMGVHQNTIHYIETGQRNPSFTMLNAIGKLLRVHPALLIFSGSKKPRGKQEKVWKEIEQVLQKGVKR